jgi:hypothetical protein
VLVSYGGFNIGMASSRWEKRMYIANECRIAKIISMDYDGTDTAVHRLTHSFVGSVLAIDDAIFVTTNDGGTNSTAYMEVRRIPETPLICHWSHLACAV